MNQMFNACVLLALVSLLFLWGINWAAEADLVWCTFLGGSNFDCSWGIVLDDNDCPYLTGYTESSDFPITNGVYDTTHKGSYDVFVAKLNSTGSNLIYSTFLGGSTSDFGYSIALDSAHFAYITGYTESTDFPTTLGALDAILNGYRDAFVVKLSPTGSTLVYATFLGGNRFDLGYGIAVDDTGSALVTGKTSSTDFPATPNAFETTHNGCDDDAFVAKLNPTGNVLDYATFLGGDLFDNGVSIVIDDTGTASVIGTTESPDFPTTVGAFDSTHHGNYEAFVTKLSTTGSAPIFSTFLGGSGYDYGYDIALDALGYTYATGSTETSDFPTSVGAYDESHNGSDDIFVTKINPAGTSIDYSTFLGGSSSDCGYGIALKEPDKIYVTGGAASIEFPTTTGAFDETYNGERDAFVVKLEIGDGDPNPPEAIVDLTIQLCKEDLVLRWSAVTADTNGYPLEADFYFIHRDTVAFFAPGSNRFDSTANTFYMDTSGVVGDIGTHYYYTVTAISGGKESKYSHYVGEIDRHLTATKSRHY